MEEQYVQVQNLTGQTVAYRIDEDNVRRAFGPFETKKIAYSDRSIGGNCAFELCFI